MQAHDYVKFLNKANMINKKHALFFELLSFPKVSGNELIKVRPENFNFKAMTLKLRYYDEKVAVRLPKYTVQRVVHYLKENSVKAGQRFLKLDKRRYYRRFKEIMDLAGIPSQGLRMASALKEGRLNFIREHTSRD